MHEGHTVAVVVDHINGEDLLGGGVDAAVELSGKQVDAHDAEDEPKDKADEQHVEDGWDGAHQRVYHNLLSWKHQEVRGQHRLHFANDFLTALKNTSNEIFVYPHSLKTGQCS